MGLLRRLLDRSGDEEVDGGADRGSSGGGVGAGAPALGAMPIGEVTFRSRVKVAGRIRSIRVAPWADVPTLECTLVDDTGGITVVFLGRREVAGIRTGTTMLVEGMAGDHQGRLAILNPDYVLLAPAA